MSKQKSISGLNLHFLALMRMVDDFKNNNLGGYEYFEALSDRDPFDKTVKLLKAQLIRYKINQILNLMIDYSYYYDFDASVTDMQNILQYAFNYLDELDKS